MPLTYRDRGTSGTQLDVLSGDLVVGSINKEVLTAAEQHAAVWKWTLGLHMAPKRFRHHGNAESLEEAREAVERNWALWVKAAE